nr:IS3 family transposase [Aquimarina agarivorans]
MNNRITSIFYENKEIYGSTRIQKILAKEELNYSVSYIGRLMNLLGLKSILKKKFVITTDSDHTNPIAENILNREFDCEEIGKKWVSDITYIPVANHWNYLTTIIDLADRKLVGWSLSKDMTTENTVYKAWLNARNNREVKRA